MPRKRHSEEKIICALKQIAGGAKGLEICREMGVSEPTLYNWKKKYAGMGVSELRRLKQLEEENRRLKGLVADLTLDKQILQEVLKKNLEACAASRADPSVGGMVRDQPQQGLWTDVRRQSMPGPIARAWRWSSSGRVGLWKMASSKASMAGCATSVSTHISSPRWKMRETNSICGARITTITVHTVRWRTCLRLRSQLRPCGLSTKQTKTGKLRSFYLPRTKAIPSPDFGTASHQTGPYSYMGHIHRFMTSVTDISRGREMERHKLFTFAQSIA